MFNTKLVRVTTVIAFIIGWIVPTNLLAAPPVKQPIHHESPEGKLTERPKRDAVSGVAAQNVITFGRFQHVQVNVDSLGNNIPGDAANEPSIAVDRNDPNKIAIGWREFATNTNAFRQAGWSFTTDGGQTWTFPGTLLTGANSFASDPLLESDPDGKFFYASLETQRDPNCGWSVYVHDSIDGGQTWSSGVYAEGADKAWITIDRTNGIGRGNIYMVYSPNSFASCTPGLTFTRSTDSGLTWGPAIASMGSWGSTVDVGPDGAVYTLGSTFGITTQFILSRSLTAQDPFASYTFEQETLVDLDGERPKGGAPNPVGLIGQANVAVDHSGGPTHGFVYALSSVDRFSITDPADVMFARSRDGGLSFEAPIRINTDSVGNGAWQWFGTMSVAPNGRIDVVWNDTRNDPNSVISELYYSFSLDGGVTWSPNEPIGPPFNSIIGQPVQQKIGDYYDMVSANGGAYLTHSATYNGEQDVYYTWVTPDCNGNGIADADDIGNLTSPDCNGNLIPDECEPQDDCNTNSIQDICDTAGGTDDCNHNFVPDSCEPNEDCNINTIRDICEIGLDNTLDCDFNGVPDDCELVSNDCNSSGRVDVCDIRFKSSLDCNGNDIPDECDISSGVLHDLNNDGIPDECSGACCICEECVFTSASVCADQSGIFQGIGTSCAETTCFVPPDNDLCENAIQLTGVEQTVPFDNSCAGVDGPSPVTCDAGPAPFGADIWYQIESPCCGQMTVSLCSGTTFDSVMAIYGGQDTCSCPTDASTQLGCGDDTCGVAAGAPTITIPVVNDACYSIRIAGFNDVGNIEGTGNMEVTFVCDEHSEFHVRGQRDVETGDNTGIGFGLADVWADGNIVFQGQAGATARSGNPGLDNGVHFFDISTPDTLEHILEWKVPGDSGFEAAEDVKAADGCLFISLFGGGNAGVEIVDVRDPFAPSHLSFITIPGFEDVKNSFYDSGYLYLANGTTNDLAVVDLTSYNPNSPPVLIDQPLWTINVGSSFVQDLTVQNGVLYVAAWDSGLFVYDVSNIAGEAPVLLGSGPPQLNTNAVWPTDDGKWALVSEYRDRGPLRLYELVPDGANIQVLLRDTVESQSADTSSGSTLYPSAQNVVVVGHRAYVAWNEDSLRTFDVDPIKGKLVPVGTFDSFPQQGAVGGFFGAWGVYPFLGEDRIILSDLANGLFVLRLSNNSVTISYPNGRLELVDPDIGTQLTVELTPDCTDVISLASVFTRNDSVGGDFVEAPFTSLGNNLYLADIPGGICPSRLDYYLRIETDAGDVVVDPPGAPDEFYTAEVGRTLVGFSDDFETDMGWTVSAEDCPGFNIPDGQWERADPFFTGFEPEDDYPGGLGTLCYVTEQAGPSESFFSTDVDGGPLTLTSPTIPTGGRDVQISYARWFYVSRFLVGVENFLVVEVSVDSGANWIPVETISSAGPQWILKEFLLSDITIPGETATLRFTVADCNDFPGGSGGTSVGEALIDNVRIAFTSCVACQLVARPLAEPIPVNKSRYVSFIPGNAGEPTALRVTLANLDLFGSFNGQVRWVGPPQDYPEGGNPVPTFSAAQLQCEPHFMDWGNIDLLHVFGSEIVPSSTYEVQAIHESCIEQITDEFAYSLPLVTTTAKWGDVVEPFNPPSVSAQPSISDILSIVDKWLGNLNPIKASAQLIPELLNPSLPVGIADILADVDAWLGTPYPFDISAACP